jgi:hypothetical protein
MIPALILLVALYVMARMAHLIIDKSKEISIVTAALAILTILAAVYAVYVAFTGSAEISRLLK